MRVDFPVYFPVCIMIVAHLLSCVHFNLLPLVPSFFSVRTVTNLWSCDYFPFPFLYVNIFAVQ